MCSTSPCLPRPEGGIEPLRLSSATGLKPAHQTTGAQLGDTRCLLSGICTAIFLASVKSGRVNYLRMPYKSLLATVHRRLSLKSHCVAHKPNAGRRRTTRTIASEESFLQEGQHIFFKRTRFVSLKTYI
ncbi:hypothetical protein CEXT_604471 [Caerostris extrusa]|uniref:Uncharacterized protein n=1 Tax=Caerostris extrusa TaxID=172846 RepID=A0AAV4RI39_CAEEX|nr:hypothetical protein CEXT_604471 [Caerostris extrusa]